ncbi:E3 ubiquitin-protein ligase COP1-like [Oppia nitens]|uniref:E3 ubiquitin-protein ligase COP1-like n=1 Tax=Oppia nitens TaxID=1686743 RepID=UPI0023DA4F37|nr:E3 ubiquitin-protein ligase COP1-like [Oppia nitens]
MAKKSQQKEDTKDKTDKDVDIDDDRAKRIAGLTNEAKNCPICLVLVSNRSLTDTCLHEFCYECLHEWSANKNRCPVCRQIYHNIIHNIKSGNQYDSEVVPEVHINEMATVVRNIFLVLRLSAVFNNSLVLKMRAINELEDINKEINNITNGKQKSNQKLKKLRENANTLQTTIEKLNEDLNEVQQLMDNDNSNEEQILALLSHREENIQHIYDMINILWPIDPTDDRNEPQNAIEANIVSHHSMPSLQTVVGLSVAEESDSISESDDKSKGHENKRKRRNDCNHSKDHSNGNNNSGGQSQSKRKRKQ